MKYLKLYENFNDSDIIAFSMVEVICQKYGIKNNTINDDGTIDVDGDVFIEDYNLTELPLKFRNITGTFNCSYNKLTTLEGCPKSVGGSFNCSNNQLTSLEYCPISVIGSFNCNNNQLTSLEYCPISVGSGFNCSSNQLTSLKFCPKSVGGNFACRYNDIRDFIGFFESINFYCDNNPIYEIWELFMDKSYIELLNEYDCIRGKDIVIHRLNEFLEEIDKPTVKSVKGYNNI